MKLLNPENQASLAKKYYQRGNYEQAIEEFSLAKSGYETQGKSIKFAEMANNQCVALLQIGNAQAALESLEGTENIFEESNEGLLKAMSIGNMAACLEALNQINEAETEYKRCASLLKELGEGQLYAETMKSLSALQLKSGKNMEALVNMQTGSQEIKGPNLRQRMLKKLLELPSSLLKK